MYILLRVQLPANNTIFIAVIILLHAIKNIYLYETYTAPCNISTTVVFVQHAQYCVTLACRYSKSDNYVGFVSDEGRCTVGP